MSDVPLPEPIPLRQAESTAPVEPPRVGRRRLRWVVAIGALVVAVGAGWGLARRVESPAQVAARAGAPVASWVTARVEQRVLAATVVTRGDVAAERVIAVSVPASVEGAPVVTGIPKVVGEQVAEGEQVVDVSGRPVFALQGDVPVYRSMRPGMEGADVAQLQAAFGRLGCAVTDEPGLFGESTKACVESLYANAGFDVVRSSTTEIADLSAAEQAVTDAESALSTTRAAFDTATAGPGAQDLLAARLGVSGAQRGVDDATAAAKAANDAAAAEQVAAQTEVDRLAALVGADPGEAAAAADRLAKAKIAVSDSKRSGQSQVAAAQDALTLAQASLASLTAKPSAVAEFQAVADAVAARDRAVDALGALRAVSGPTVPVGEVVFVPTLPARVQVAPVGLGPVTASVNGAGPPSSGALAELASGSLVVSVRLRSDELGLVRLGMPVSLLDEQSNATYAATISTIDEQSTIGADGTPGYSMRVVPSEPLPEGLAGVNVRVTITAASSDGEVLVVPVAAVSSKADGTTFVSVIPDGASLESDPVEVPVSAGLSADGFVAVEPSASGGLTAGSRVVVGR